ncbi:hypothetical protein JL722_4399 [Aureococcus anophagefferens]|nr:hypothetical protein JL722_4399 [Aureococcus anophagefferens]
MGSAHWSGWQTICDMLHDPKPSNRASAVQTLRSLTHDGDEGDARWREGEKVERVSRREVAPAWGEPGRGAWAPHASWRSAPDDDGHQRRRVVRAVVANGGVAPLVDLLSSTNNAETQRAAADVLRNVISSTARDDANDHEIFVPDVLDVVDDREQVREAPRVEKPEDASFAASDGASGGDDKDDRVNRLIMEEADIVQPILGLLEHPSENVRTSALGTMSELVHNSEEARAKIFQEPELLPRLLDVADERVGWSRPEVDAAEAVSVFKLMLDDELNSASARAAISAGPGVVKSIVDAATQALPPDEEAVLHRLGCSVGQPIDRREVWAAREANDALVGLGRKADNDGRENGFEPPRVDDDVADDDEGDDGDFNRRRRNLAAMAAMRNLVDADVDEDALSHNGDDVLPRLQALRDAGGVDAVVDLLADRDEWGQAGARAGQESEIPNFKGSFLGRFPLAGAALTLRALVRAGDQGGAAKTPLDTVEEASEEDCVEAPPPVADEAPVEGSLRGELADAGGPAARVHAEPGPRAAPGGGPGRRRAGRPRRRPGPVPRRSPSPAPEPRDRSASRSPSPVRSEASEEAPEPPEGPDWERPPGDVKGGSSANRFDQAQLKAQLKDAIDADRSVIQTIVDLLQDMVRAEGEGFAAAHDLAETLRTIASSDLVARMRIRDAGGVRPLMAVLAKSDAAPRPPDAARRGPDDRLWLGGEAPRTRRGRAATRTRSDSQDSTELAAAADRTEAAPLARAWLGNDERADGRDRGRRRRRTTPAPRRRPPGGPGGLPAYELGLHSRITSHPSGFRRWHVTHELVANSRRRVREAERDARRIARLAELLRQEKVDLVDMIRGATVAGATSGLAQRSDDQRTRGAGRDERERVAVAGYGKAAETPRRHRHGGTTPGLVQYDVVQSDLRSLKLLQRRVRLETAAHETATHADEEVDPAAGDREGDLTTELHLLDSTLSALGEMRDVS